MHALTHSPCTAPDTQRFFTSLKRRPFQCGRNVSAAIARCVVPRHNECQRLNGRLLHSLNVGGIHGSRIYRHTSKIVSSSGASITFDSVTHKTPARSATSPTSGALELSTCTRDGEDSAMRQSDSAAAFVKPSAIVRSICGPSQTRSIVACRGFRTAQTIAENPPTSFDNYTCTTL